MALVATTGGLIADLDAMTDGPAVTTAREAVGHRKADLRVSETKTLRVHQFDIRRGCVPAYASAHSAGLDLTAALEAPLVIVPGQRALVPTGIALELPSGHEGQVRPRSGLAMKHGVTVLNAPGTIDEDFRGEIRVLLVNLGADPYEIVDGDRIAQLVVAPISRVDVTIVPQFSELGETSRGHGGFGSTGR